MSPCIYLYFDIASLEYVTLHYVALHYMHAKVPSNNHNEPNSTRPLQMNRTAKEGKSFERPTRARNMDTETENHGNHGNHGDEMQKHC